MKRTVKFEISNRVKYTLLSIMILILAGTAVYAYSSGGPPSYVGHTTDEIEGVCLSDGTNCSFDWDSVEDSFWVETVIPAPTTKIDWEGNDFEWATGTWYSETHTTNPSCEIGYSGKDRYKIVGAVPDQNWWKEMCIYSGGFYSWSGSESNTGQSAYSYDGLEERYIDYSDDVNMGRVCLNDVCESGWSIGTLESGKWCTGTESVINCQSETPTGTTLIQCPLRKVMVYEFESAEEWEEHVSYDVCTIYTDYVKLSNPLYCNGATCYNMHYTGYYECLGYCDEFGFTGSSSVPSGIGYSTKMAYRDADSKDWISRDVPSGDTSAENCLCYP